MLMNDNFVEKWQRADEEVRKSLPPGVKLVHTLRGHTGYIGRIAWSPDGRILASPSKDKTIRLWNTVTGECMRTLEYNTENIQCVAFDPTGHILASASGTNNVELREVDTGEVRLTLEWGGSRIWAIAFNQEGDTLAIAGEDCASELYDAGSGELLCQLEGQKSALNLAFDPARNALASFGEDRKLKLWDPTTGKVLLRMQGHQSNVILRMQGHQDNVYSLAFDSLGQLIASGSEDRTIKLWDLNNKRLISTLEGHNSSVNSISFCTNSLVLASKGGDNLVCLWHADTGDCIAKIPEPSSDRWPPGLAFHPRLPLLATVGSDPRTPPNNCDRVIHIYELDLAVLCNQLTVPKVTYTSAKVVLVGDSGVGKTGLGWRLAHGKFKEHSSTHGQQFWLLNQLCKKRRDGTQCEAVLWDLAGQPDYRLIHALFLDDADLALLLFDPARDDDLLNGVGFWLKQLKVKAQHSRGTPTILIAARSDRGTPRLTNEELNIFCKQQGIKAYMLTSAKSGEGIEELVQQMQNMIPWDDKPATITTETFKRIKDFVLDLKEMSHHRNMILTPNELRKRLQKTDQNWKFSNAEMMTAVGHLENHGYVTRLKTSQGEPRILLAPELLNNLAASFVLEARRNPEGLGSLEEQQLLLGEYKFPELEELSEAEKDILLDSVAVLFLEHNICFRETNPLNNRAYLVFPELINMKKPMIGDDTPIEDGVAYTVSGAVENVYASLVVLMGYTQDFTRTNQWQNHARYEMGTGHVCGFRLEDERAGELYFVLYFGVNTPAPVRMLFQGLFENFLRGRNLTVQRIEPVLCPNGHTLNRSVVREHMSCGEELAFCNRCGEKITLPKSNKPIHLTRKQAEEVEANRWAADQRSRFEQVLYRLKSYVTDKGITSPECFISYAWGGLSSKI